MECMKTRKRLFASAGIATILCSTLFAAPAMADGDEVPALDATTIQETQTLEEDEKGFTQQEEEVQDEMLEKAGPGTKGCEKVTNPYSFFSEYSEWRTYQTVKDQLAIRPVLRFSYVLLCVHRGVGPIVLA